MRDSTNRQDSRKNVTGAERKTIAAKIDSFLFLWAPAVITLLASVLLAMKCSGGFLPPHNTTQSYQTSSPSEAKTGKERQPPPRVSSFRIIDSPSPNVVGRHDLLTSVHNKFQELLPNKYFMRRVVALVGTSGVGKTEAACQFAEQYKEYYDNVAWVDAGTETSAKASFLKIARTLNIPVPNNEVKGKQLARLVYRHVNEHVNKTALFIFDHVNQLQSTEAQFGIYEYLPTEVTENPPLVLFISQQKEWGTYSLEIVEVTQLSKDNFLECLLTWFHISPVQLSQDSELQVLLENLAERLNGYPMELRAVAAAISDVWDQRSLSLQLLREKLQEYIQCMDDNKLNSVVQDDYHWHLYQQPLVYIFSWKGPLSIFLCSVKTAVNCCLKFVSRERLTIFSTPAQNKNGQHGKSQ